MFGMLATSDVNGNVIIWKILSNCFTILTEISNISESAITNLTWSPEGGYLYISNTNGSVYTLDFSEYLKGGNPFSNHNNSGNSLLPRQLIPPFLMSNNKSPKNDLSGLCMRNSAIFSSLRSETSNSIQNTQKESIVGGRRRIAPVMMESIQNSDVDMSNIQPENASTINTLNALNNLTNNSANPLKDCIRCHRNKIDSLETKMMQIKLSSFGDLNMAMWWENKIYDSCCIVQLLKNGEIIYSNKFENKLARFFVCNSVFYAIYDTNNVLNVFSLFNNMVNSNLT